MSHLQRISTGEGVDPTPTSLEETGIDILIEGTSYSGGLELTDEAKEEAEPSGQTETETERQNRSQHLVCLYQAAIKGNWQKAKDILDKYPYAVRVPITKGKERVLHIAAAAAHTTFVTELVERMNEDDLKLRNKNKQTALYFAAVSGIVTIAKEIMKKQSNKLTLVRGKYGMTPLYIAALLEHKDMVSYLFSETPFKELSAKERIQLLVATISNEMYDTALEILKKDPSLATARVRHKMTPMHELARKPIAIGSKTQLSVWERLNSRFKGICHKDSKQTLLAYDLFECLWKEILKLPDKEFSKHVNSLLFDAAEVGNENFLIILIRSYPDLIWKTDKKSRSIFHIAVLNRQETVFDLIHEIGAIKDMILTYVDDKNQNILHLAGKLPQSGLLNATGAAFQMQREMLWFKKVESIVVSSYLNMKTNNRKGAGGLTPWELFTMKHTNLRANGEKWMKETVNFYIVVATLISAVVFAAVVTVPGGSNQDTGTPILLKSIWFRVFFTSNAIALLFSSASILIYLSILTSRFREIDFLVALPLKWVLGVITLIISIVGMVVSFSATCFLVLKSEMTWLPIVIIVLAGVQIICFVSQHSQLWFSIIHSASLSKFLCGRRKKRLF